MEYEHQRMSKQEFNKKICGFKTNYDLYFFLIKTLLQIKFNGFSHCFCDLLNQERCQIYQIVTDFNNFEDELCINMTNVKFFKKYQ